MTTNSLHAFSGRRGLTKSTFRPGIIHEVVADSCTIGLSGFSSPLSSPTSGDWPRPSGKCRVQASSQGGRIGFESL